MKKILLITISLLMVYMSFGQTNGISCNTAVNLVHQDLSVHKLNNQSMENWFEFTATSEYVHFAVLYDLTAQITLYSGTCTNLTPLKSENFNLEVSNLTIGEDYLIKVIKNNINDVGYTLRNTRSLNNLVCQYSTDQCNKIFNGDFTLLNFPDFTSYSFPIYPYDMWCLIEDPSRVPGWSSIWSEPNIMDINNNNALGVSATGSTQGGHNDNTYGGAAYSCVALNQGIVYLLNLDYETDLTANSTPIGLNTRITLDDVDVFAGPTINNLTSDIDGVQRQITSYHLIPAFTNSTNTTRIFSPDFDAERFYVYADINEIPGPNFVFVDNIQITPIQYSSYIWNCPLEIEPECWNSIQNIDFSEYTFSWSTPAEAFITQNALSLNPTIDFDQNIAVAGNTYIFTLTLSPTTNFPNENNQVLTIDVEVTYQPFLEVETTDLICFGDNSGTATAITNGAVAPFDYFWSDNSPNDMLNENLAAGDYTLTVIDANGCENDIDFTINEPLEIITDISANSVCDGNTDGNIDLTVTNEFPPFNYTWTGGIGDIEDPTGLAGGTYDVTVTNANGCTSTNQVTIGESTTINPSLTITDLLCNGVNTGEINTLVTRGVAPYSYNIGNGTQVNTNFTGLAAGDYTVTVTDANGCTGTATATLIQPNEIVISALITHIECGASFDSGAIDITVTGGTLPYDYVWTYPPSVNLNSNIEDPTGLIAGEYLLTVIDENDCKVHTAFEVLDQNMTIQIQNTHTYPSQSCGIATAIITGGIPPFTYLWEDDNSAPIGNTAVVTGLSEGAYSVTITDNVNCTVAETLNVNSYNTGIIFDQYAQVCEGESLNIFPIEDIYDSYNWNTGGNNYILPLQNIGTTGNPYGDYTCNMYGGNGCRVQQTFHVMPYVLDIDVDNGLPCIYENTGSHSDRYTFSATAGYDSYSWSATEYGVNDQITYGPVNLDPVSAGQILFFNSESTYTILTVTATSPSGCVVTNTATVYFNERWNGTEPEFQNLFSQDWVNKNYVFFTNVVFDDNLVHNIVNSHIEFAPGYGIFVSERAQLNIDNSEITGIFCADELWKGIIVDGTPNQPHTTSYQPILRTSNQTVISGAKIGALSFEGGILDIQYTNFINNNSGVVFDTYTGSSTTPASKILHNDFITNHGHSLLAGANFKAFIHLYRFPSMLIWDNNFTNSNYDLGIMDRGTGINSTLVNNLQLEYGNTFNRLTKGLVVSSTESLYMQHCHFKNNYQGADIRDISLSSTIRWNDFDDAYLMPTDHAFQMFIIGCYQPNIAQNDFNNGVVGLYLAKANQGTYQIYKNTFTGFNMYSNALNGHPTAIYNKGKNGTLAMQYLPTIGVEFKCNTFLDYDYAIAIMGGTVKGSQGEEGNTNDAPAGNYFLDDENLMDGVFYVSEAAKINMGSYNYHYYYHQMPDPNPYDLGDVFRYTEPIAGIKGVAKQGVLVDFTSASCPSQSPWGSLPLALSSQEDELNTTKSEISTKQDDLVTKVDLGNTELLLSDIAVANDDSYTALVQDIQEIDSYLSDVAAIEFMDKATDRPVAKAIALIANSPLPNKAKDKIADLDMDESLKDYITAQQDGLSKREQDEAEIHRLKLRKYKLLTEAVQMAHIDETGVIYTQVIDLLLEQDEWKQKEIAYHMLKNGPRQEEATAVFLELQQDLTKFDEQKQYHMEDYLQLLDLETRLDSLSDSLRVVNIAAQEDLLQTIMASEFTEGRVASEFLLEEAGLDEKEALFIQLPNPEESDQRSANNNDKKEAKSFNFASSPDLIEVYPNPVKDRLTVEYLMFNGMTANTIGIYDINGKLMLTQGITKAMDIIDINVAQLSAGTYIIAFGKDGANSNSTKFIVK